MIRAACVSQKPKISGKRHFVIFHCCTYPTASGNNQKRVAICSRKKLLMRWVTTCIGSSIRATGKLFTSEMNAMDRHRQRFLLQVQNPLHAQQILAAPLPQHRSCCACRVRPPAARGHSSDEGDAPETRILW
jgi:hypothetical protein